MIDESLCWLIANNKIKEARKVIKNACKWNRKNYNEVMEEIGWGHLVDYVSAVKPDETGTKNMDENVNPLNDIKKSEIKRESKINEFSRQGSEVDSLTTGLDNGDCINEILNEHKSEIEDLIENNQKVGVNKKETKVMKYTIIDLFRHKRILIVSAILWYTW